MMIFPYGRAPACLLLIALATGLALVALSRGRKAAQADIVFALFAKNHLDAYVPAVAEFEREHKVKVQIQLVSLQALQSRLQAALMTDATVPDLVEIVAGSLGYFTRGPLRDAGFVDLTERVRTEGLATRIVASRFACWSSRGRIFAIPHDVHPVMLCYRKDLTDALGINVDGIRTWDDFTAMGRRITADTDGDGNPDRYALDLPATGAMLPLLMLQNDVPTFDAEGRVAFACPAGAEVVIWYLKQTKGKNRIAYDAGWGQPLARAMTDGLVLFYFCPDWRTKQFEMDVPSLKGKLALMPLPAWRAGGRRTSTWGGSGLAITKAARRPDLCWALAKKLYFDKQDLGRRFLASNIIPPFKDAWGQPEFKNPSPFYSGQPLGLLYAQLAPQTPPSYASPCLELALNKLSEAFMNCTAFYDSHDDDALKDFTENELARAAAYVSRVMNRNAFLKQEQVEAIK